MTLNNDITSPSGNQAGMSGLHCLCLRILTDELRGLVDLRRCLDVVQTPSMIAEFKNRVNVARLGQTQLAPMQARRSEAQPQSVELKALAQIHGILAQAWSGELDFAVQNYAEQSATLVAGGASPDVAAVIADAFAALEACLTAFAEPASLAA